ncbi:MAG: flagellar basal-body rod protein FlgG [Bacillota bacterium]
MLRSINSSASGINAHAKKVDVIAHNIANINTTGYKKQAVSFSELYYRQTVGPGAPVARTSTNNSPILEGSGVRVAGAEKNFEQGPLVQTGRDMDFAIQGEGLFEVMLPTGELAYTRDGVFKIDENGWITTAQGYRLTAPIMVPENYRELKINVSGEVTGKNLEGEIEELGSLFLVSFTNQEGLESIGENLFIATEASGDIWEAMPGEEGLGQIRQGFLESSNVFLAEEITNLIEAQRAYQLNSRALQAADEMWAMANNLRR